MYYSYYLNFIFFQKFNFIYVQIRKINNILEYLIITLDFL